MLKKILKSEVKELLRQAVKEWKTFVPLEDEMGDTLFSPLPKEDAKLEKCLERVNLRDEAVIISPKDIFFPQLETMFHFNKGKLRQEVESSKKLIFGIRPCDTKGMLFADNFFKKNYGDIYYLSRAKDRLIVTIGCLEPPRPEACFCTSAKTGPFIQDGYDLQLADAGDSYLVELGSSKGEDFVNSYSRLFRDAESSQANGLKKIKSAATKNIKLKVNFEKALEVMKGGRDFQENYNRIAARCIYCGGCLYVCPTCTCFNVFDDGKEERGLRRRNWDACVFEGYTREASGHNPRGEKALRTARRYEHKLKYDYGTEGMSGCIACGRCLVSCPVEIGMSKFIEEITEGKRKM